MGRPPAADGIRARINSRSGFQEVHLQELPGVWTPTPETDRESAISWARRNRMRIAARRASPSHGITLRKFAKGFYDEGSPWVRLQADSKRKYSTDYLPAMRGRLANHILPRWGDCAIESITADVFLEWLVALKKDNGSDLSNSAKNKVMDCMKHIIAYALFKRVIEMDTLVSMVHLVRDEESRELFTDEEVTNLFPTDRDRVEAIWQTQMWLTYFLVLRDTGARPSEIHALRWEDYDAEFEGFAIVNSVDNTSGIIKNRTKTGSVKPAYLSPRTIQELKIWKHFCPKPEGRGLVFSMDGVRPLRTETAAKHFRGSCKRAQVERKDRTPYCLRHTFATSVLEELPLAMVQQLLGHSIGSSVTKRSYYRPSKRSIMRSGRKTKEALDEMRREEE